MSLRVLPTASAGTFLVRQRVFGLALGYEDLNDHQALRHDIALQTAVDTDGVLASQSTLCRFEQQADLVPSKSASAYLKPVS